MSRRRKKKATPKASPKEAHSKPTIKGKHADLIIVDDLIGRPGVEVKEESKTFVASTGWHKDPFPFDVAGEIGKALKEPGLVFTREMIEGAMIGGRRFGRTDDMLRNIFRPGEVITSPPFVIRPTTVDRDVMAEELIFYADVSRLAYPGGSTLPGLVAAAHVSNRTLEAMLSHGAMDVVSLREQIIQIWWDVAKDHFNRETASPPMIRLDGVERLRKVWQQFFPEALEPVDDPELNDADGMSAEDVRALRKAMEDALWLKKK